MMLWSKSVLQPVQGDASTIPLPAHAERAALDRQRFAIEELVSEQSALDIKTLRRSWRGGPAEFRQICRSLRPHRNALSERAFLTSCWIASMRPQTRVHLSRQH